MDKLNYDRFILFKAIVWSRAIVLYIYRKCVRASVDCRVPCGCVAVEFSQPFNRTIHILEAVESGAITIDEIIESSLGG